MTSTMDPDQVAHWADYLLDAADTRTEVDPITGTVPELTTEDAYEIQAALVARRVGRGERIVGAKLGLTSRAKQEQMGVDQPVYGWITEPSVLGAEDPVVLDDLIHPRCEPELVFIMGEDLEGTDITRWDVLEATARVVGGIEIIDSRYKAFSFTLTDVIADNTSAARVAIGQAGRAPSELDLRLEGCVLEVDGDAVATAAGAALLGDPAGCVAMLANHLGRRGQKLEKGWIVMAGSLTDAQPLAAGTVATASYGHLSAVTVRAR